MEHPDQNFETLSIVQDGPLARLTLTRPELLNRLDEPAHHELIRAFRLLNHRPGTRAVLWTAEGKHFSAGGDLSEIYRQQADPAQRLNMFQQAKDIIYALLEIPYPVVVALHGDTYGLGASLILCCDVLVACRKAKFGDTHVKIGLVAGDGGAVVWPASAGMMRAKRHLLTGKLVTGDEAYHMGMVSDLVDTHDECRAEAEKIAWEIAALPPIAVQGTKRTLNAALRHRASEVLELGLTHEQMSVVSSDLREAVDAFREKRPGIYHER
jgi:enoyl-CoA hydratase